MTKTKSLAVEDVELRGHIIDSLILPRILDLIMQAGGSFAIKQFTVGQSKHDVSCAVLEVQSETREQLDEILGQISAHGAVPTHQADCHWERADIPGAFPEGFYSTTNQRTQVRIGGQWIDVLDQEMDCGIVVLPEVPEARCVAMTNVELGMNVVLGHSGVRVFPEQRDRQRHSFEFMTQQCLDGKTQRSGGQGNRPTVF